MAKSIREQLGMNHKAHALKHKTGEKLHKTHHSREYCRHCGVETSRSTRHESGHREYDHESMKFDTIDAPKSANVKR